MGQMTDFQLFIKTNKLKQKQVAEYLGTSPQYISQVAKGTSLLSDDKYELLVRSNWNTSMLKIPSYINVPSAVMSPYTDSDQINSQQNTFAEAMKAARNIITDASSVNMDIIPAEVVEEVREELRAELSIPVISSEVSTKTGFNIVEYIEANESELEQINPSELFKSANAAEKVLTTSMLPTFAPGDIVFVRVLQDRDKIVDGATYYFNIKSRPTMIRKAKIDPNGKLRLVAKNKDFGDIIIDRSEVLHIAKIVGLLRMTFTDQYDEIEALRSKKEQQIDNLIEEIRDAGKRADILMSHNLELMKKLLEK